METSVVRSTSRGSSIAYQSWTDNVRAHADMKNLCHEKTYIYIHLCPKGYNSCLQGLNGLDKSHPGHLPLLCSRLWYLNLLDSTRQEQSVSKRLHYVWTMLPTQCPHHTASSWRLSHTLHGVGCLVRCQQRARLMLTTNDMAMIVRCKYTEILINAGFVMSFFCCFLSVFCRNAITLSAGGVQTIADFVERDAIGILAK